MTTDPQTPRSPDPGQSAPASAPTTKPEQRAPHLTRLGAAWVATAVALLLLVLLIIFILQNPTRVEIHYLGFAGSLSLGMAMLIAAVGGGLAVAVAGIGRITQLRMYARRTGHKNPKPDATSTDGP